MHLAPVLYSRSDRHSLETAAVYAGGRVDVWARFEQATAPGRAPCGLRVVGRDASAVFGRALLYRGPDDGEVAVRVTRSRWLGRDRHVAGGESDEERDNVTLEDGAGCLLDGCCLAGFLLDLAVVSFVVGGAVVLAAGAVLTLAV